MDSVENSRVRFYRSSTRLLHGVFDHAPKINPDILELVRGKTGRVIGGLQTLLVLVKGLPLAYNRDLQEDKPALFDAFDTVEACLDIAALGRRSPHQRRQHQCATRKRLPRCHFVDGISNPQGIPQRTAHHMVGSLVGWRLKTTRL